MTSGSMATDRHCSNERLVVIGSALRFAPGISHYAYLLSCTLEDAYSAGALLMRSLVPRRLDVVLAAGLPVVVSAVGRLPEAGRSRPAMSWTRSRGVGAS